MSLSHLLVGYSYHIVRLPSKLLANKKEVVKSDLNEISGTTESVVYTLLPFIMLVRVTDSAVPRSSIQCMPANFHCCHLHLSEDFSSQDFSTTHQARSATKKKNVNALHEQFSTTEQFREMGEMRQNE